MSKGLKIALAIVLGGVGLIGLGMSLCGGGVLFLIATGDLKGPGDLVQYGAGFLAVGLVILFAVWLGFRALKKAKQP